ncbi:hypothetical protein B0H13DRAFT_1851411 [Mycena leptocephala]|nr:hypothetical protein B0H13DRAFT_1851411 [Mycena leptocephala]
MISPRLAYLQVSRQFQLRGKRLNAGLQKILLCPRPELFDGMGAASKQIQLESDLWCAIVPFPLPAAPILSIPRRPASSSFRERGVQCTAGARGGERGVGTERRRRVRMRVGAGIVQLRRTAYAYLSFLATVPGSGVLAPGTAAQNKEIHLNIRVVAFRTPKLYNVLSGGDPHHEPLLITIIQIFRANVIWKSIRACQLVVHEYRKYARQRPKFESWPVTPAIRSIVRSKVMPIC